jgi:ketosteroid isomerase-like protein
MSESKREIVRLLFEQFERDGVDGALDLISEDFFVEVPPSLSAEPDVYEGHDGVRRYFAAFAGIDDVRFELLEFFEEGEVLITWLTLAGRGSTSGIDIEQQAAVAVWIEDGKVTRMEPHPDVDGARRAARMPKIG